ncbi:MAG TPA: AI-2E family transporter [Nitrospira sp.]|nr:AI-2E family transporter [Nitrospira sp.]
MKTAPAKIEQTRVAQPVIDLPADPHRIALTVLALIATAFALQWAQKFLIPLLLGMIIAFTLNPMVVWLTRIKIPRVIGATLVLLGVVTAGGLAVTSLSGQVEQIVEELPAAAGKLSDMLRDMSHEANAVQKMQAAARELEQASRQAADGAEPPPSHRRVVVAQPQFTVTDLLWTGSLGMFGLMGELTTLLLLVFFLLVSGPTFRGKILRLAGPSLSKKKITVTILDDIDRAIQNYMLTLLTTNVLLGLLSWVAFRGIGLDNAGAWAVAAGVLHFIPYVGPAVIAFAVGMAAFMQFESVMKAALVAGASIVVATFVGTLVVTWLSSRVGSMNAAAVFIALLFWGWLWGLWGLLLAIPIMGMVKVLSDHVEDLRPVGELLGE